MWYTFLDTIFGNVKEHILNYVGHIQSDSHLYLSYKTLTEGPGITLVQAVSVYPCSLQQPARDTTAAAETNLELSIIKRNNTCIIDCKN